MVGVAANIGLVMAALEVVNEMKQLIHLGVHDAQVAHQPDFLNIQRTAGRVFLLVRGTLHRADYRTHRLDAPVDFPENVGAEIIWKISNRGGVYEKICIADRSLSAG